MPRDKIFYGWFLVPALGVIYLINAGFASVGASVTNTYMARALQLSRGTLGLGFTVCGLLAALPSPIIAFCIKRRGIRFTLFLGCSILMLGALLMASVVTEGWHYVAVFGIIVGVGCGFGSLIPVQTGVTLWFRKKKALAMSIAITVGSLGGFVGPPLLNKIISLANGNWRIAWYFVAGLVVLSAVLALLFVKNKPSDIGEVQDGLNDNEETSKSGNMNPSSAKQVYRSTEEWKATDAMKTGTFWLLFVSSFAFVGPMMVFIAHSVMYLRDMGHTPGISAMAISYYMLFSLLGRLLGGSLGDRLEPRYIWAGGLLLEMAGILSFLEARSVVNIYVFAILVGIGVGAASICWPTLVGNYFGANSFASVMGILFAFVQIFGAASPFLAGLIYDSQGSYLIAFVAAAVLALSGSVVIFFTKPPKTLLRKSQPMTGLKKGATHRLWGHQVMGSDLGN